MIDRWLVVQWSCNYPSSAPFDVLTGVALIDWQVLIVLMTKIILLDINWNNLST